jgi:hypothetical protein
MSRASFDIRKNAPIEYARNCFVPALFAHAEGDDFIKIHHSEKLHEVYAGDKNLIRMDGDHNSERPDFFFDSVAIFFYNVLIANSELDDQAHPTGSIATKMGVGKETDKGKQIAEQERDEQQLQEPSGAGAAAAAALSIDSVTISTIDGQGSSATSQSSGILGSNSSPSSSPLAIGKLGERRSNSGAGDLGTLPSSPRSVQIVMPKALHSGATFLEADKGGESELEEDEQLISVLIDSVRDELRICAPEERQALQQRLDELTAQANQLSAKHGGSANN